jgi:phosphoribosyl-ATP pyrophosphohydrolase
MDSTIIGAIITALGALVAAFLGLKWRRKQAVSTGDTIVSKDKNEMSNNDKNLFVLGYRHGTIATKIICPLPNEKPPLERAMNRALDGLLEQIEYPGRVDYLAELSKVLREATVESANARNALLNKMAQVSSPLRSYVQSRYRGRGNASFVLGMNLPQIERSITMRKVIDNAKTTAEAQTAEQAEQLWAGVKDMIYDYHIDNLRKLVAFDDLPYHLTRRSRNQNGNVAMFMAAQYSWQSS